MIEIGDLDLPGARHLVRRLREVVRGRGVDVGLIAEQPGYGIPPHLAQLHAFVEVRGRTAVLDIAFERTERTGGILVLGHHRTVVPHHRLDAVIERLAAQLERVAPCERQLPARSAQFGVVALGRRGAVDRRQRNAGRVHVGGVAAVVVAAERETVVQEIKVEPQVVGRRLLPRQRHGHRTADRRIGGQPSAEHDVRSGNHGHLRRVGVGIDVAVAHRTGRKADLEVVEPLLRPLHPRLLRHAPRHRCRGEESPFGVGRELRRTVVAAAHLGQVLALVTVIEPKESAHVRPDVSTDGRVGRRTVHQSERRFGSGDEPFAFDRQRLVFLFLDIPACERLERVVVAQLGRPVQVGVGRLIARLVFDALEIGARSLRLVENLARLFRVFDHRLGVHALAVGVVVGVVGRSGQHVLHQIDVHVELVAQVDIVVRAPRSPLREGGIARFGCRGRPRTVGVLHRRKRHSRVVDQTRDLRVVLLMLGFVGIDHRDRHVVGQTQPRTHFKRSLGAHVVLLVAVVAHLVDAVHIVETARNIVVGLVAATRNREVVLGRPVVVLVEERMPVGRVVIGPPELVVPRKRRRARQRRVLRTADQLLIDRLGIGNRRIDMVQERLRTVVITVVAILPPVDPRQTVGHHIGRHRAAVDRHRTVVIDDGRPFLGALGRNQHDAESTACTVHRRRRSVFEHRDRLHVLRVDRIDAALHTVDQDERRTARTDRTRSADVDRRPARGFAVGEGDVQAR